MHDSLQPRILLVDDNEVLLADYRRILEPTNGAADTIFGGKGNDIVLGGGAVDIISDDDGNDLVFGSFGDVAALPVVGGVGTIDAGRACRTTT